MTNRVVAVTGGARGLGYAVARHMGKNNYRVVLLDVNFAQSEDAAKALRAEGIEAIAVKLDVTDEHEWDTAIKQVTHHFGQLDVLVQAAGIVGRTGITTDAVDPADFDKVMEINVKGIFLGCRAVLPHMKQRNQGRIVNFASISGKEGNAGMLAYSTSKAAVIGLTKVIGKEFAETNITVNAVAPAVVRTDLLNTMPAEQIKYMTDKIPMKRTGELHEIAALVEFIASPACSFCTGFTFDASGGRATY